MCTPELMITMKAAAPYLTAASAIMQGYAAQQQGEYAAGVARYNARQQENEATRIRNISIEEENKQRRLTAELLSKQRAQLGAANVELTTGSALSLQTDTALLGEVDALRIRENYELEATAMEEQAELTRAEGEAKAAAGRAAFGTSILTAGGAFLGSGVADKWFTPQSAALQSGGSIGLGLPSQGANTIGGGFSIARL